ncbi:MAG: Lrp/AsnC family transcriptional regulator [Nitrosopumilaceae archaeon]|nr:Lrp/AsnC family transcriptional regulator [Nitrosopumilaceae archaeon]NIU00562.1 Lrp/AsnC family transcriptional regulator [Nitrosopumilaceae archaeon]NIU86948.1 Lrp/AsnC family transcriptional regulator [Nitrosopumilaceae archaeon]NIV66412.1 Lrp/AsnC family transcriptional regulator [Nitrosopumilaceae archaeon]NIX61164.1 Lrp/AsnC family transcriptional regulator [Nitrosopumilaceae archaeon]
MAIILITCQPDKEKEVIETIKKIDVIESVQMVYGQYDCIAKTKNDLTEKEISNLVTENIRKLDGVRATATLNVVSVN